MRTTQRIRRAIDAELREHAAVGLEVGEVVLLLEARVADELAAAGRRSGRAARRGIASGTSTRLASRQLTWCWAAPTRSRTSSCSGSAAARHDRRRSVEPCASARSKRRPRPKRSSRGDAVGRGARLAARGARRRGGRSPCADGPSPRAARRCATAAAPSASTSWPARLEPLDERAQHQHVRRVREVDPDPHRSGGS